MRPDSEVPPTRVARVRARGRGRLAALMGSILVITGVVAVSPPAQAVTVNLGTVQGRMSNHVGTQGTATTNCVKYSPPDTTTSPPVSTTLQSSPNSVRVAHGSDGSCPTNLSTAEQSVLGFYPTATTTAQSGSPFFLGRMEHINNPVSLPGSGSRTFNGTMTVQPSGVAVPFPYTMVETPNTGDPDFNRDRITFSNQISSQSITDANGLTYRLVVLGFINNGTNQNCPAVPPAGSTVVNEFLTYEGQITNGCLYATFTQIRTLEIRKTAVAPFGAPAAIPAFTYTPTSSLAGSPWSAVTANNFSLTPTAIGPAGTVTLTPAREILATGETVTVTEGSPPTDWALTALTCTDSAGAVTGVTYNTSTRAVTLANVPEVTTVAQARITCTFTNTYTARATLTLVKSVVNTGGGNAVPANWNLTATASGANAAGRTEFSGVGNSAAVTNQTVIAGQYTLTEAGNTPVTADYVQTGGWVCTGTGSFTSTATTVTPSRGAVVTCTVTNTFTFATLTLVKDVQLATNPPGSAVDTQWTLSATGPTAGVTGTEGQPAITSRPVRAGTYTLAESGPTGYLFSNLACRTTQGTDKGATVTNPRVALAAGENVTCSFTNSQPQVTVVKTAYFAADTGFANPIADDSAVARGSRIVWRYLVTNTGRVPLTNVAVTDAFTRTPPGSPAAGTVPVTCPGGNPIPTIAAGASVTCSGAGTM